MKWFLKKADRIVVATQGHIEGSDYLKSYREKCIIIPFGVREEILEDSKSYFLQQQNQKDEKRIVRFLFVGRLTYYKGCKILLQAFQQVKQAKLILVGDGPLKREMEQYIIKNQMQKQVELKGWLNYKELFQEYRKCDVFVLPSIVKS